jgi:hypothetical protein
VSSPTVDETVEWVAQHHWKMTPDDDTEEHCGRCLSRWPCVPVRLAAEVEALVAARERTCTKIKGMLGLPKHEISFLDLWFQAEEELSQLKQQGGST